MPGAAGFELKLCTQKPRGRPYVRLTLMPSRLGKTQISDQFNPRSPVCDKSLDVTLLRNGRCVASDGGGCSFGCGNRNIGLMRLYGAFPDGLAGMIIYGGYTLDPLYGCVAQW